MIVDGVNVITEVHEILDRMGDFRHQDPNRSWKGHTGEPIRNVVNIGIGGSDLGPVMAYEALRHYTDRDLTSVLPPMSIRPTSLRQQGILGRGDAFHCAAQNVGTLETLTNATSARDWVIGSWGRLLQSQSISWPSTNADRVAEFGIDTATCSLLGLGRRAVLHGLCHWLVDDGGAGPTAVR